MLITKLLLGETKNIVRQVDKYNKTMFVNKYSEKLRLAEERAISNESQVKMEEFSGSDLASPRQLNFG